MNSAPEKFVLNSALYGPPIESVRYGKIQEVKRLILCCRSIAINSHQPTSEPTESCLDLNPARDQSHEE